MVFIVDFEGNTTPLAELIGYIEDVDQRVLQVAATVALEAFNDIRQQMLNALQFYPPVPPGSTYKRTFRLRRGWQVDLSIKGNEIALVVFNPTRYTKWVMGDFETVVAKAARTQREFHRRNGWPLTIETSLFWFDKFKAQFIELFIEAIIEDIRSKL